MGRQLTVWIESPVLLEHVNSGKAKRFDLSRFLWRNFSLDPFEGLTTPQFLFQLPTIDLEDGGQVSGCLFRIHNLFGIGIDGIDLDAHGELILLSVVNDSSLWNERNLNMVLLASQCVELLLLKHLKLKHSSYN